MLAYVLLQSLEYALNQFADTRRLMRRGFAADQLHSMRAMMRPTRVSDV